MKYFKTDGMRMNANELIFSLIPLKLGRILGNVSKNDILWAPNLVAESL